MSIISKVLIAGVAIEHLYILWLEMFVWTTVGKRTFRSVPAEMFEKTKSMAANQGLYNGFLAAGLIWSLLVQDEIWSKNIGLFFLSCVITAGIYGAFSVQRSIFFIQSLPALVALVTLLTF
jgi:putative membrane protein